MLFDLTWQNTLAWFVIALVAGFGWAIGVWLAGRVIAFLASLKKPNQA